MAQLNDLIVNGNARFLNTIKGTIENSEKVGGHETPASGNASTTQVVLGNDTRLADSRTPTSHTHGNIQNGGTLQTSDITIANGDKLVVTDSSDSSKIARASISFDGSTTTKCLTQKGTWESFGTGGGDVTGPSSSTSGNITTFSSGTGKAIQDSGKTFSTGSTDTTATHVVLCNDTRLSDSRTPKSHTHGNIQNNGTLQTTDVAVQNGDKLVVTDANASTANSVVRSSIAFDASTATKCLTQKGTWENFSNNAGTITSVKTTAGAHTTINVTSGAANFNVPTKTSHLTNDSGYVTTDTTYTLGTSNNNITLTPSSGNAQSITAPYSNSSGGIHYCETDDSSTATAFIVNGTGITSLYNGIMLCIKNTKIASASGCTINVDGLGAKGIWLSQGNSACTTHWALNQTYLFVYDETNERWVLQQGRDTDANDTYTVRPYYTRVTTGGNGIKGNSLFARMPNNKYSSFTTGSGTGTKTFDTTNYFDPGMIVYYNGSSNVATDTLLANNTFSMSMARVNMRYSANGVTTSASTSGLVATTPVYLIFDSTQESNGCYKLKSPYYTQVPNDTSAIYVLLGYMEDSYRLDFWVVNPIFTFDGTQLIPFEPNIYTNNLTVLDSDSNTLTVVGTTSSGSSGSVRIYNSGDTSDTGNFYSGAYGGRLKLKNTSGAERIDAYVTSSDGGRIDICDTNGTDTITLIGSTGAITATTLNGATIGSSPVFTDTKATQTLTSDNKNYPLLFAYVQTSNTDTNSTNGARRNNSIYVNPSTGNLQITKINGVTVGSSPKFTDTDTLAGLTDTSISNVVAGDILAHDGSGWVNTNSIGLVSSTTNRTQVAIAPDDTNGGTVSLKDTTGTYTVRIWGEGGSTQGGVLRTYFKNGTMSSFLGSNTADENGLIKTWSSDGYTLTSLHTSTSNGGSLAIYTGSNDTNYIGAFYSGINGGVLELKSSINFAKTRVLLETGNADGGLIRLRNSSDTDTITIDGHAGKVTASALKIGNYTYGVTSLYSGSLGSGSTTFNYGDYKAYLVVGEVQSGGSWISQLHPKEQLLTSDIKYILNDEVYYVTYLLKYSGSTVTLTFNTKNSDGKIRQVWGIN